MDATLHKNIKENSGRLLTNAPRKAHRQVKVTGKAAGTPTELKSRCESG